VRGDVAMTGEITLHGNVLPIGGLREKSMAAYRENIKTVLIPKGNESNLYDVDEEVKKSIRFVPVSTLAQVLNEALIKPKAATATSRTRSKKSRSAEPALLPTADKQPKPDVVC
jgi:ATP-dependent Lon protease